MRLLLDNGTPRGLAAVLVGHAVEEPRARAWDGPNLQYQQNLARRKIAIVVLGNGRWKLIKTRLIYLAAAVTAAAPNSMTEVDIPLA